MSTTTASTLIFSSFMYYFIRIMTPDKSWLYIATNFTSNQNSTNEGAIVLVNLSTNIPIYIFNMMKGFGQQDYAINSKARWPYLEAKNY